MTRVIPYYKKNVAALRDLRFRVCTLTKNLCKVDSRFKGFWHRPGRRYSPVPTIDQSRRRICQTRRLKLWKRNRREDRCEVCSSISSIVTYSVNIQLICVGICLYLELNGFAKVDAHLRGESLYIRITRSTIQVPNDRGSWCLCG